MSEQQEKAVREVLNATLPKWDETSDPVYRVLATEAYRAALRDAVGVLEKLRDGNLVKGRSAKRREDHFSYIDMAAGQVEAAAAIAALGMPCGHPVACVVSSDEGTSHCGACERESRAVEEEREGTP